MAANAAAPPRVVFHADLDAFYASVEQLDRPELRGKPVLVGGAPEGRGVVAACSYEARRYGVHSAMPMRTAVARCPGAVIVSPRFDRYREMSQRVFALLRDVTPLVEPASLDEAYMDVTEAASRTPPETLARTLKARVRSDTGLSISIGVAGSKSVAKIASDLHKPDGLTIVSPGSEAAFLAPLAIRKLGGIGPRTEERLKGHGVTTLGQLAARSDRWLAERFGKRGPELAAMARGQDQRPVVTSRAAKSVSAETTFARDISDAKELNGYLERLSERVAQRLQKSERAGRTITMKLRLADFTTFTRSVTLPMPVHSAEALLEAARALLLREIEPGRRFRLLGVGVSGFDTPGQPALF